MSEIQEFVAQAHGDVDAVRNALAQDRTLANAAWDWGGGDWESALGAAAHMGRRDLAELLIGHGARIDVFAAAMLDEVDVVRGLLALYDEEPVGPHGIPLRAHAEAGKAERVLEFLADG
jgi:hypothetical protein